MTALFDLQASIGAFWTGASFAKCRFASFARSPIGLDRCQWQWQKHIAAGAEWFDFTASSKCLQGQMTVASRRAASHAFSASAHAAHERAKQCSDGFVAERYAVGAG